MSKRPWQLARIERDKKYSLADGTEKARLVLIYRWRAPGERKPRRYRVRLGLDDTRANRRIWQERCKLIAAEIAAGVFDPTKQFGLPASATKRAPNTPQTVGDMTRRWQSSLAGAGISSRTREQYDITLKAHIYGDPVENITLAQLSKEELLDYRHRLIEKELSQSTVNKVFGRIRSIVDAAFQAGLIPRPQSPVSLIRNLRNDTKIADPFTPDEVLRILWACKTQVYRAFYLTLALTAMRPSECLGLTWRHIAFDNKLIYVRQQRLVGGAITDELKNQFAYRDIEMFAPVAFALRELRPDPFDPDGAVFLNPSDGEPMKPNVVGDDPWYEALDDAEVPHRTMYNLRHSYCSFMISAGKATQWISAQLGHATMHKVETVYGRWTKMPTTANA